MNVKFESLGRVEIHVCPNLCGAPLTTSAHVMQEWQVDAEGDIIDVIDDCLEVTHGPDCGNIWTCDECGEEASLIDAEKYHLLMDEDGCYFDAILYVPLSDKLRNDVVLKDNLCEPIEVVSDDGQFTIFGHNLDDETTMGALLELNMARRYLRVLETATLKEEV